MKNPLPTAPPFGREAKLLFVVSGVTAVSFYGITMLIKVLYILRLGHGPEYVGLFGATSALAYMGMSLPSGLLGGRFGARNVMRAGGVATVVGMVLLPMTEYVFPWARNSWPFLSQVVLTLGWSMFNVNLVPALMATTTAANRNGAFALSGAVRGLGTFVGTISGGLLPGAFAGLLGQTLDAPAPYRMALWVGAFLGLLALVPMAFIGQVEPRAARSQSIARGPFPLLPVALVIGHVFLNHAGWATSQAFTNAYLDTELRLSPSSIGLITGAGQFVAILAPLLTPRLAARRSNGWTLMMTALGLAVSLVPMALIQHWAAAGLGRLGVLVFSAIWLPALQVFQMELVDPEWRPMAYGAISMAMGLGFGSLSLVGGYVVAAWGYRTLFLMGAGLVTAGAGVMWGILRSPAISGLSSAQECAPGA
ncbi:MAG: MFS transporter [Anaerolineae bacterium]|nr:MFS transporter [Anaerolineae bacterium]